VSGQIKRRTMRKRVIEQAIKDIEDQVGGYVRMGARDRYNHYVRYVPIKEAIELILDYLGIIYQEDEVILGRLVKSEEKKDADK